MFDIENLPVLEYITVDEEVVATKESLEKRYAAMKEQGMINDYTIIDHGMVKIDASIPQGLTKEYCWREKDSETAYGPFKTREEAISDARDTTECEIVLIGTPRWADPLDYIDMERIVEDINEQAYDNDFSWCDDDVFNVDNKVREEAELELRKWATKYIKGQTWYASDEEEVAL